MAVFSRRSQPPIPSYPCRTCESRRYARYDKGQRHIYGKYRPYVREDFLSRCAYCMMDEVHYGGKFNFELDHFKPKKEFGKLVCRFTNLYYCCNKCNRTKSGKWPSPEAEAAGYRFLDPCSENPYKKDLRELQDYSLSGHTNAGCFTIKALDLNRDELITYRKFKKEFALRELRARQIEAMIRKIPEKKKADALRKKFTEFCRLQMAQWLP
jgi:hypothetical protein